ncbi:MAG: hypothetical protein RL264_835 [Bacteroidota bacterium]|jgi:3-deoxy-D-manno-octulosonic-acid transferase
MYSLFIRIFGIGISIAALFNDKAKRWVHGRQNQVLQLPKDVGEVLWFHCASLGEFDQGLPLMNALKQQFPERFLVVSFFSPSGMEHYHKRHHLVDKAVYLPLDTRKNAQEFIEAIRPKWAFFVKYEFWFNHLEAAHRFGTKLYSVSTLMRPNQMYFQFYGRSLRKKFHLFEAFFVQDETTLNLLQSIGLERVYVTGDLRIDNVIANRERYLQQAPDVLFSQFLKSNKAIVFGSSWEEEEAILLEVIKHFPNEKFIVAPHDVSPKNVARLKMKFGKQLSTYTAPENLEEKQILLLDTIGQLALAYRFGKLAFIGGGFSGKLHNILEPAVFGIPVFFGPNHAKFPEAMQFIEEGVAFEISNKNQFIETTALVLKNQEIPRKLQLLFQEGGKRTNTILHLLSKQPA